MGSWNCEYALRGSDLERVWECVVERGASTWEGRMRISSGTWGAPWDPVRERFGVGSVCDLTDSRGRSFDDPFEPPRFIL